MRYRARVILSFLTSAAARASAAVYVLAAFPLILNAVGSDRFSIFLYALNFPTWLSLAILGAHGSTIYHVSHSSRGGNSLLFRARFGIILIPPFVLVTTCAIAAMMLVGFGVVGPDVSSLELIREARWAIVASIALTATLTLAGTFENFALGAGRVAELNAGRIAAVAITLAVFFLIAGTTNYVPLYVAVSFIPQLIILHVLGIRMINRAKAWPIFRFRFVRRISGRRNAFLASGFFMTTLPFLLNVQLGATIIGLFHDVSNLVVLLLLLRVLVFGVGFFSAITNPAWPLLGKSYAAGDWAEFQRNAVQLVQICTAICLVVTVAFYFFGEFVVRLWLPTVKIADPRVVHAFAIYLGLYLWNTLWLAILSAVGRVQAAGYLSVVELFVGLALGLWLFGLYQSYGYLMGLIIGTVVSTSSVAPILGLTAIGRAKALASRPAV